VILQKLLLVTTGERLIEIDFANWEGKRQAEFVVENPLLWAKWSGDPATVRGKGNGENAMQVVERAEHFFSPKCCTNIKEVPCLS
jgi:broad specificity phosphatase PhoE